LTFETDQLESIFQLIKSGFGMTLILETASPYAAGCALVPLQGLIPGESVIFEHADMY
jgi:hypothetical protein